MFFKTILFTIVLLFLCLVGLGIGLIITGKSKLKNGCGHPPDAKKNCDQSRCEICKGDPEKKPPQE